MSDEIERLRADNVIEAELLGSHFALHTTWGLFSPRAIDEGSRLLLDQLEVESGTAAIDLGCGYGPLGLAIARRAAPATVHLVDRDFVAVDYARANARRAGLDNVEVYLSNGFDAIPDTFRARLIVSNLPAKVGNEALRILFHDAHRFLDPGGRFVVVTINGLRSFVKREFVARFGHYDKLKQGRAYTVSMAVRDGS